MLRNGLTYGEASTNANRVARQAYDASKAAGNTDEMAQYRARAAYEKEMRWYEGAGK